MFDMRSLPSAARTLSGLTERERVVLRDVGEGLSPRDISERLEISEEDLYRLVAWVLDELEPAPRGETMTDVYARHGSKAATLDERAEFERRFGPSLEPDDEG
jgi:DNA-binding CsgD family transcriptional regulator